MFQTPFPGGRRAGRRGRPADAPSTTRAGRRAAARDDRCHPGTQVWLAAERPVEADDAAGQVSDDDIELRGDCGGHGGALVGRDRQPGLDQPLTLGLAPARDIGPGHCTIMIVMHRLPSHSAGANYARRSAAVCAFATSNTQPGLVVPRRRQCRPLVSLPVAPHHRVGA